MGACTGSIEIVVRVAGSWMGSWTSGHSELGELGTGQTPNFRGQRPGAGVRFGPTPVWWTG